MYWLVWVSRKPNRTPKHITHYIPNGTMNKQRYNVTCNNLTLTDKKAHSIEKRRETHGRENGSRYTVVSTKYAGNILYKVVARNDRQQRAVLLFYRTKDDKPIYATDESKAKFMCDAMNYRDLIRTMNWSFAMNSNEETLPILERLKPIQHSRAGTAKTTFSGMRSRFYFARSMEEYITKFVSERL